MVHRSDPNARQRECSFADAVTVIDRDINAAADAHTVRDGNPAAASVRDGNPIACRYDNDRAFAITDQRQSHPDHDSRRARDCYAN
jgi:hypothetical protein